MKLAALALALSLSLASACQPENLRVRYTIGFDKGSKAAALAQVVDAYEQRLEKSAGSAKFATDAKAATITVEFPFAAAFVETKPEAKLASDLAADAQALAFTTEERVPVRGLAYVDEEWLRYDESGGERGLFGTKLAAHAAGAALHVFVDDRVRTLLAAHGEFEFLRAHEAPPEGERERLDAWRKTHPDARLKDFDSVARDQGGPLPGTVWRRHRVEGKLALLVRPPETRFRFGSADLAEAGFSSDEYGYPAASFELKKERQKDFEDWTGSLLQKGMAIVLDDEILILATVNGRLPGKGIITGGASGFSAAEVEALVRLLRQPALPVPPRSVAREFLP